MPGTGSCFEFACTAISRGGKLTAAIQSSGSGSTRFVGLFARRYRTVCAGPLISRAEIPMRRVRLWIAGPMIILTALPCWADIFRWEYINPADPSQGKRQSTTLAPDGAGVDAVPGAVLDHRDLTMAYLIGADLSGANAGTFFPSP